MYNLQTFKVHVTLTQTFTPIQLTIGRPYKYLLFAGIDPETRSTEDKRLATAPINVFFMPLVECLFICYFCVSSRSYRQFNIELQMVVGNQ